MLHVVCRTDMSRVQFFPRAADLLKELQTRSPRFSLRAEQADAMPERHRLVRKMLPSTVAMYAEASYEPTPSVADAEHWLALGTGALLLIVGASRRSIGGACLAASSV